jgi:hypothetical protein
MLNKNTIVKLKKIIRRIFITFLILIPISALAHFIFFPQQTRSILIDFSSFKKQGSLYFNAATPQNKADSIQSLIELAKARVSNFWGSQSSSPKYIYCYSDNDFKRYGSPIPLPALTHIKLGACIVLSNQGVDLDIIAHELSHAEFYERIGFYNWLFKIPRWFDEGLAMQNDYRNIYSEDSLTVKTNNYTDMPDVKKLISGKQFYETGNNKQITLNYMLAKHEVKNWYTSEKLDRFIKNINEGESFEKAYGLSTSITNFKSEK